jgi:hypothetical protein
VPRNAVACIDLDQRIASVVLAMGERLTLCAAIDQLGTYLVLSTHGITIAARASPVVRRIVVALPTEVEREVLFCSGQK